MAARKNDSISDKNSGFTLIELSLVITMIILFTGMVIPLFIRSLAWWQLDSSTWSMVFDIRRWQQKAEAEQKYGFKLVVDSQGKKYFLKEGTTIKETHDLSKVVNSISVSPSGFYTLEFYPTGMTSAAGTYALGDRFGRFKYIVILNTTGRVRVSSVRP